MKIELKPNHNSIQTRPDGSQLYEMIDICRDDTCWGSVSVDLFNAFGPEADIYERLLHGSPVTLEVSSKFTATAEETP